MVVISTLVAVMAYCSYDKFVPPLTPDVVRPLDVVSNVNEYCVDTKNPGIVIVETEPETVADVVVLAVMFPDTVGAALSAGDHTIFTAGAVTPDPTAVIHVAVYPEAVNVGVPVTVKPGFVY